MTEHPTWTERPPNASFDDLQPGTLVGEYRIIGKVATGGMGAVYAAMHPVIGKKAAIKILFRSLCTSEESVQRFVDEARAVNRIGHQNIIDVFAFGSTADGRSYFVMEWLEGETLFHRMARARLSIPESVQVLDQLSDALEAAHRKGIIHRDIKPENVFLVQDRDRVFVKLLDFGVAKLGMQRYESEGHSVLGTPAYVSPEQASARDVDHRTDIYSLGVLAYEMFLGRRPFEAEAPIHLLGKHVREQPPAPRSIAPATAPILDELLLRMLAKAPNDRPSLQEVREVLGELGRASLLAGREGRGRSEALDRALERPMLLRRFTRIADLASELVLELSRGIAWVTAQGNTPDSGTPVLVRFEVERVRARVDFGGIVIRHLGAAGAKTLIRYDRVSKEKLDGIFATLASTRDGPHGTERAQGARSAIWIGPDTSGRAPIPSERIASSRRVEVIQGSPAVTERVAPAAPESLRVRLGLGAKVLALAVLVTIGAVAWLAVLALAHARTDRGFYVRELTVRTSQLLLDGMVQRLDKWKGTLVLAALGGSEGRLSLGELETLTICPRGRGARPCTDVAGDPLEPERIASAERGVMVKNGDLFVLPSNNSLILAAGTEGATAIATIPRMKLLDLRDVADELTVVALGARGEPLLERSYGSSPKDVFHHAIMEDLAPGKSGSGAREYAAPDGTPMFGAWTKTRDLGVVLIAPTSVSEKATRVLAEQVLWVALVILGAASTVALVFARTMTRRLRLLARHAGRVAEGDFTSSLEVRGRDEVAQLSSSFQSMTTALKQRDEDVLRIQQKMSEDASEALHRQMSEWLGMDLAPTLGAMQALARRPIDEKDPLRDLHQRSKRIEALSGQASLSLQQALALAAIASRRIDLASTVADAIAYVRTALHGSKIGVELEAKNAVLFPRLEARESEIRELVQTLVGRIARALAGGDAIHVSLHLEKEALVLAVHSPRAASVKEIALGALGAVDRVLEGHGASAKIYESQGGLSVLVEFPHRPQDDEAT